MCLQVLQNVRTQWCLQVLQNVLRTQWCLLVLRMYLELVFTSTTKCIYNSMVQVLRMYLELNGVYKYYECT